MPPSCSRSLPTEHSLTRQSFVVASTQLKREKDAMTGNFTDLLEKALEEIREVYREAI